MARHANSVINERRLHKILIRGPLTVRQLDEITRLGIYRITKMLERSEKFTIIKKLANNANLWGLKEKENGIELV